MKRRSFIRHTGVLTALCGTGNHWPVPGYGNSLFAETKPLNFDTAACSSPADEILKQLNYWNAEIAVNQPYQVWFQNQHIVSYLKKNTANLLGAENGDIALCRNTTEGIDLVLKGTEFEQGDKIVYSNFDFPYVQDTVHQLHKRNGVTPEMVNLDLAGMSDDQIISSYMAALGAAAKLVILTQVFNWNGRILPIVPIASYAREKGVQILIDGAQAFANLQWDISLVKPDFYAGCFHKWFRGIPGTGFLFISNKRLKTLWPLHGGSPDPGSAERFEMMSTINFPAFLSLNSRFDVLNNGYFENRKKNLKYLTGMLTDQLQITKGFQLMSLPHESEETGILAFNIKGYDPEWISQVLVEKYHMYVKWFSYRNMKGLRISLSDHITTTQGEMLAKAIADVVK